MDDYSPVPVTAGLLPVMAVGSWRAVVRAGLGRPTAARPGTFPADADGPVVEVDPDRDRVSGCDEHEETVEGVEVEQASPGVVVGKYRCSTRVPVAVEP
jgi:hypothetical protein